MHPPPGVREDELVSAKLASLYVCRYFLGRTVFPRKVEMTCLPPTLDGAVKKGPWKHGLFGRCFGDCNTRSTRPTRLPGAGGRGAGRAGGGGGAGEVGRRPVDMRAARQGMEGAVLVTARELVTH